MHEFMVVVVARRDGVQIKVWRRWGEGETRLCLTLTLERYGVVGHLEGGVGLGGDTSSHRGWVHTLRARV